MLVLRPRPPPEVGRSVGPFRPPKISAALRRSVGRSRPTRFFFAALRAAVQGAVPTLIFLAALCAAVGRSDRSDPKISSPRSARRSVGRTRPTRNRPLAREVGRSVGDANPTINFVPPFSCASVSCASLSTREACASFTCASFTCASLSCASLSCVSLSVLL